MLDNRNKLKCIFALLIAMTLSSCGKQNKGEFLFYLGGDKMVIDHYEIYQNDLDNLFLVVKDYNKRNFLIKAKIDSLHYVVDNKIHKAEICKISGKLTTDFHLITQNSGTGIFVNGVNKFKQELLSIGQKNELKFITDNNDVLIDKEE